MQKRPGPQPFDHLPNQIELSAFDCLDRFEAGEEFARLIESEADERDLHRFGQGSAEAVHLGDVPPLFRVLGGELVDEEVCFRAFAGDESAGE